MPITINTSVKGKEYPPYRVNVERGKATAALMSRG